MQRSKPGANYSDGGCHDHELGLSLAAQSISLEKHWATDAQLFKSPYFFYLKYSKMYAPGFAYHAIGC